MVDVYWSHQSPYCYFVLDRILALQSRPDVEVKLRPVLPGVLRIPEVFADTPNIEQRYFTRDVHRTAEFLGVPYAEANPYPVEFRPDTLFAAARTQSRVYRLYYLTAAANERGRGWGFIDQVARLIWDGSSSDWHTGDALQTATERAGLDYAEINQRAEDGKREFDRVFTANHDALVRSGLIVVDPVFRKCLPKVLLRHEDEVVHAFPSQRPDYALADRVGVRSAVGRRDASDLHDGVQPGIERAPEA